MSDGIAIVKLMVRCGAVFVAALVIVASALIVGVTFFLMLDGWL